MSELEALVLQLGDMVVKTRERCDVLESSFLSIQESNRQTFQAIQQDIDVKIKAMEESFAQVSKQLLATQEENAMLRKTIEEFQGKDSHFATSEDLDKKSGELQTELEEFKKEVGDFQSAVDRRFKNLANGIKKSIGTLESQVKSLSTNE